jgi:hypothetical protein
MTNSIRVGGQRWWPGVGPNTRAKECSGRTGLERRSILHGVRLDIDRHQGTVGRKVEQLAAIAPPVWLPAALVRNAPHAIAGGKVPHVDFVTPGFVGGVSDPTRAFSNFSR